MTPAVFKRSIRDLQVWCSSCMIAFSGSDPIGVLIGAKRPSGTLVHKIAVHPDHRRQGHARHMLASLGSKLAILGPPRMVAEVPETFGPAGGLFSACGYVQEAGLTDYLLELDDSAGAGSERPAWDDLPEAASDRLLIPVTVDDLAANGLLEQTQPQTCWERAVETLTARKDDIEGLAVAYDERIEAYILYRRRGTGPEGSAERASALTTEIVSLRSFVEDGGTRLRHLLSRLGMGTFRFPKVHPAEISNACLETLGFSSASAYRLYAARARSG